MNNVKYLLNTSVDDGSTLECQLRSKPAAGPDDAQLAIDFIKPVWPKPRSTASRLAMLATMVNKARKALSKERNGGLPLSAPARVAGTDEQPFNHQHRRKQTCQRQWQKNARIGRRTRAVHQGVNGKDPGQQ